MQLGGCFDSTKISYYINELEQESSHINFWQNRENAEATLQKIKVATNRLTNWQNLLKNLEDTNTLLVLALEEKDESQTSEIEKSLSSLNLLFTNLTMLEQLKDPDDSASCYITIHAGSGGTESCDWVRMLARMYSRYASKKNFSITILDEQEEDGGYKSYTMQVDGNYAYGILKSENGVHRMVRISPFDSNARRHTTFASVQITPVINHEINIIINDADLRIDTYRASGAGGQKINKTDSAVRITHLPSGIVVQCQNERSQYRNKEFAMAMIKSRLYNMEKEREAIQISQRHQSQVDNSFGSQIRSYIFQPYTMVKDNRTKIESNRVLDIIDGDLDIFIEGYLNHKQQKFLERES